MPSQAYDQRTVLQEEAMSSPACMQAFIAAQLMREQTAALRDRPRDRIRMPATRVVRIVTRRLRP